MTHLKYSEKTQFYINLNLKFIWAHRLVVDLSAWWSKCLCVGTVVDISLQIWEHSAWNRCWYLDGFVLQSQPVERVDSFACALCTAIVDEPVSETLTCIGISVMSSNVAQPVSQLLIIINSVTSRLVDSYQQQRTNVTAFTPAPSGAAVRRQRLTTLYFSAASSHFHLTITQWSLNEQTANDTQHLGCLQLCIPSHFLINSMTYSVRARK